MYNMVIYVRYNAKNEDRTIQFDDHFQSKIAFSYCTPIYSFMRDTLKLVIPNFWLSRAFFRG